MRKELSDIDVEQAVGGTVVISKDFMKIGFSTLGVRKKLKNCTFRDARNKVDDLYEANPGLSDQEFDQLVKDSFEQLGWI